MQKNSYTIQQHTTCIHTCIQVQSRKQFETNFSQQLMYMCMCTITIKNKLLSMFMVSYTCTWGYIHVHLHKNKACRCFLAHGQWFRASKPSSAPGCCRQPYSAGGQPYNTCLHVRLTTWAHAQFILPYFWYPAFRIHQAERAFHTLCPTERALLVAGTAILKSISSNNCSPSNSS